LFPNFSFGSSAFRDLMTDPQSPHIFSVVPFFFPNFPHLSPASVPFFRVRLRPIDQLQFQCRLAKVGARAAACRVNTLYSDVEAFWSFPERRFAYNTQHRVEAGSCPKAFFSWSLKPFLFCFCSILRCKPPFSFHCIKGTLGPIFRPLFAPILPRPSPPHYIT